MPIAPPLGADTSVCTTCHQLNKQQTKRYIHLLWNRTQKVQGKIKKSFKNHTVDKYEIFVIIFNMWV